MNHLDAALGACDALLEAQGPAADVHDLLRLELTAIAHVLQAREDMKDLKFIDGAVRSQIALFLTITSCLEETTPSGTAAANREAGAIHLIGGRIDVATLMALMTAMRDIIELCFLTSGPGAAQAHAPTSPISEALVWATGPEGT